MKKRGLENENRKRGQTGIFDIHLLVTPSPANGLAKLMQAIGRRYVPYINATYHRTGTLWEGRYRASLIEAEAYFLLCSRYIELNPARVHIPVEICH